MRISDWSSDVCSSDLTCVYTDQNTINRIDGDGHNYFRSRNLNKTESKAVFGEFYWDISENLKLTSGLRLTEDRKVATPINSQLLLGTGPIGGGFVSQDRKSTRLNSSH